MAVQKTGRLVSTRPLDVVRTTCKFEITHRRISYTRAQVLANAPPRAQESRIFSRSSASTISSYLASLPLLHLTSALVVSDLMDEGGSGDMSHGVACQMTRKCEKWGREKEDEKT